MGFVDCSSGASYIRIHEKKRKNGTVNGGTMRNILIKNWIIEED
ncbi:hypothetical protein [Methanosarcina acetivorans]|nr:hypothetical protein [Methanosarcina acetivorans]